MKTSGFTVWVLFILFQLVQLGLCQEATETEGNVEVSAADEDEANDITTSLEDPSNDTEAEGPWLAVENDNTLSFATMIILCKEGTSRDLNGNCVTTFKVEESNRTYDDSQDKMESLGSRPSQGPGIIFPLSVVTTILISGFSRSLG